MSGTTLTFSTAPPNGTSIEVMAFTASSVGVVADGSISTAKLADDAVTQAKIGDDAVGADQLASNSVVTASIVDSTGSSDGVTTAKLATSAVTTAKVADDAITLAKMAGGTDGNLISYDANGDPVAVATGNAGQVLTSAGAGAPQLFKLLLQYLLAKYSSWGKYNDSQNIRR